MTPPPAMSINPKPAASKPGYPVWGSVDFVLEVVPVDVVPAEVVVAVCGSVLEVAGVEDVGGAGAEVVVPAADEDVEAGADVVWVVVVVTDPKGSVYCCEPAPPLARPAAGVSSASTPIIVIT